MGKYELLVTYNENKNKNKNTNKNKTTNDTKNIDNNNLNEIILRNIPIDYNVYDIYKLFINFDKILDINLFYIKKTNKSTGVAIIKMNSINNIKNATKLLNSSVISSKNGKVKNYLSVQLNQNNNKG